MKPKSDIEGMAQVARDIAMRPKMPQTSMLWLLGVAEALDWVLGNGTSVGIAEILKEMEES